MANPTCNAAKLIVSAGTFANTSLTNKMRKALRIYFLTQELATIGGTNYSTGTALPSSQVKASLFTSSENIFQGASPTQLDAAVTQIVFNNASSSGATPTPLLVNQLIAVGNLLQMPDLMLDKATVYLQCQLGYHAAYPQ